ncbi:hypothetical protein bas30_0081 [Escherichia phage TrudiRoth]|uniref:Uncharacterized protein n=3 Tax=Viruses TaxID=10239 RepID=A0AAE7VSF0_9CAUD|nr:hypothetical protein bas26_0078 [Escherichia phage GreteKellenberger]QXV85321.1 hypothetical protein bas30_0081 [Escherichia phage TrudiRoth]
MYSSSECLSGISPSYLILSDRRIRTCIFHQLRFDITVYTRTAVLSHKSVRHPTNIN